MKLYKSIKRMLDIDHASTGNSVRSERTKHNISLRRLANAMGVSPPYLSDLERGKRNWTEQRFDAANDAINKTRKENKHVQF